MQTQADQTGALKPLLQLLSATNQQVVIMEGDQPVAVVLSVEAFENLEDDLALARYEFKKATGTVKTVSQEEAKRRLGLA